MNRKTVEIFSCYELTYKPLIPSIMTLLYGEETDVEYDVKVIDLGAKAGEPYKNIMSQRRPTNRRIMRIWDNDKLEHDIAFSNTNYDEDTREEFKRGLSPKNKSTYGEHNYHANTYLTQGTANIEEQFADDKKKFPEVKCWFYLMDTDETYPHNLFNVFSYRMLETIGFSILNIADVDFTEYEKVTHSKINKNNIKFPSVTKFMNDMIRIAKRNSGNKPFILAVPEIGSDDDSISIEKYQMTIKTLAACSYDAALRCRCLKALADKENRECEFFIGRQSYDYSSDEQKVSDKLPSGVATILDNAGIKFEEKQTDDYIEEKDGRYRDFNRLVKNGEYRSQQRFVNAMLMTLAPACALCGEDGDGMYDAAHLCEAGYIKNMPDDEVFALADSVNIEKELEGVSEDIAKTADYLRYVFTNHGENGIFLCPTHHRAFDRGHFCINPETGEIVFNENTISDRMKRELKHVVIDDAILTKNRRAFLVPRWEMFCEANGIEC